jgi:hypothetical protein
MHPAGVIAPVAASRVDHAIPPPPMLEYTVFPSGLTASRSGLLSIALLCPSPHWFWSLQHPTDTNGSSGPAPASGANAAPMNRTNVRTVRRMARRYRRLTTNATPQRTTENPMGAALALRPRASVPRMIAR